MKPPARQHAGWLLPPLSLLLALPAAQARPPQAAADYLQRMDADGDGRVSLAEYLDWMRYAFDAMDRNRDGVLSSDELPGGRGKPVTRAGHRQSLEAAFRRQDIDRDGFLSARELAVPPR
ncbi:EF-hand domain-containing protein [Lysobacter pythonis]|uniref:EF-hand domain-containing protein n=1 Tax=Solilutibacter pythonis TaxID=2483112 RepID=A0A3M2HI78_9GAMM|nr:EF-hand domain-containing protein [Lysobacter pythonis]RMH88095.1 EF-hand domain-containing protein [Lysobacter pythonis]